jgi:hypothetical protein
MAQPDGEWKACDMTGKHGRFDFNGDTSGLGIPPNDEGASSSLVPPDIFSTGLGLSPLDFSDDTALDSFGARLNLGPLRSITVQAASAPTMQLYDPGSTPVSVNDLHQDALGDCYLISSIGEIALNDPSFIEGMIHANYSGTGTNSAGSETVTLYAPEFSLRSGCSLVPEKVTVNNVFPSDSVDSGATQDVVNGVKVIWPQVLEQAYATLNGGYGAIGNGGSPVVAMEELTGQIATAYSARAFTPAMLAADVKAGDLIVMDTASACNLPYGLVGNHAYMFESLSRTGMVQLGNPWGSSYNPSAIPESQLAAAGIVEIDVGRV